MAGVGGAPREDPPLIGVLALQGDFASHRRKLVGLGAQVRDVRTAADLDGLDGLIIPGGESTVIAQGVAREHMTESLSALARAGVPVLGTCAGLIMLDRDHLGLLDARARRNAFGRQRRSFETELELAPPAPPRVKALFIRAPWLEDVGKRVEVLAEVDGHPVAVRQGNLIGLAFHPELGSDTRVHEFFLDAVCERLRRARQPPRPSAVV